MSANYNSNGYLNVGYSRQGYFDFGIGSPFNSIVAYYPTGYGFSVNVIPFVSFDPSIQSGSISITLFQSGVSFPVTPAYTSGSYTETITPKFPLYPTTFYNVSVSGIAASGSFTFGYSFETTILGTGGGKHRKVIIPVGGRLMQSRYNIVVDINE